LVREGLEDGPLGARILWVEGDLVPSVETDFG